LEVIRWLEEWYLAQCNGDWEHGDGIKIYTIDNPGWGVRINITGTRAAAAPMQPYVSDRGDDDWVRCELTDGFFVGHGDPRKLGLILERFQRLVEQR
jgi:immunity protein 53 of polymorphic toxin system